MSEAFTSKTCRVCGNLNNNLGGNKVFPCPTCSETYPRDDGGSSGICLRFLTLLQEDRTNASTDTPMVDTSLTQSGTLYPHGVHYLDISSGHLADMSALGLTHPAPA
jgi:hypothetical protein